VSNGRAPNLVGTVFWLIALVYQPDIPNISCNYELNDDTAEYPVDRGECSPRSIFTRAIPRNDGNNRTWKRKKYETKRSTKTNWKKLFFLSKEKAKKILVWDRWERKAFFALLLFDVTRIL
jgi:hypothetical protein